MHRFCERKEREREREREREFVRESIVKIGNLR